MTVCNCRSRQGGMEVPGARRLKRSRATLAEQALGGADVGRRHAARVARRTF